MSQTSSIFEDQFKWQAKYMHVIKRLVGPLLLVDAPLEVDMKECTDLIMLTAKDIRIGCRMRRSNVLKNDQWVWEFTLRSKVASGAKTELKKVVDGWGDWLFYGIAGNDDLPVIERWLLIDLKAWRAHMLREYLLRDKYKDKDKERSGIKWSENSNGDGTKFIAFDVRTFPSNPAILIASSHEVPPCN